MDSPLLGRRVGRLPAVAVVLGTNDIASAIGWRMARAGWGVLLLRDLDVAVLRRGMAFDDAMEDGAASLDGVVAVRAADPAAAAAVVASAGGVAVGRFGVGALIAARVLALDALVDARMHKYAEREDWRPLAACAVGVGPGFVAGSNVHVAVESLPGAEGAVVAAGPTASPTGKAIPLAGAGAERFVYAPLSGPWVAEAALGAWVEAGQRIGRISGVALEAPLAGTIRGLVRSSPHGIVRGTKLLEIDPRRGALCRGIAPRPGRIAAGVAEALGAGVTPTAQNAESWNREEYPSFNGIRLPARVNLCGGWYYGGVGGGGLRGLRRASPEPCRLLGSIEDGPMPAGARFP